MHTGNISALRLGIPQSSHVSWQWQFKWDLILLRAMSCCQQTSIEEWHRPLFPQCILLQHLKFPITGNKPCWHDNASSKLALFTSKNKQVVQIQIQVSHVEAVLEWWSLGDLCFCTGSYVAAGCRLLFTGLTSEQLFRFLSFLVGLMTLTCRLPD